MALATSGNYLFNLPIDEILDEAFSRVGGEYMTGRDASVARRSLNLLILDLINRGLPLSTLNYISQTLTQGTASYTLANTVVDIAHAVLTRSGTDIRMNRISLFQFDDIPRKDQQGKPLQFTVDRTRDAPILSLWPTPENSTDVVNMWVYYKVQDVDAQYEYVDLPTRYLPAIVAGLAYYLSLKFTSSNLEATESNMRALLMKVRLDEALIQRLKQDYEELINRALEEDRERSSFYVTPCLRMDR